MFCESLRKVLDRIKGGLVNLRAPLTIPNGNYVHTKVMLAAVFILTLVVFGVIIGSFGSSKAFVDANSAKGFGVGIYWNQVCTNRTLSLCWGLLQAGSNNTLTVYIKNEGSSAASLWLGTSNWTPSIALGYISLDWNYSGQVLIVGQVIPLELTLAVSPTIDGITSFSFDTIITTSER